MRLHAATAVAVLICAVAPSSIAHAQGASSVDQIPQSISRATLATSPQQVRAPGARDRMAVSQLPSGLAERAGSGAGETVRAQADAAPEIATLAPAHRRAGSVDADEIARILDEGSATSIDAAAAIASGLVGASPARAVVEERRPPPPPGSLFSDLPGGRP